MPASSILLFGSDPDARAEVRAVLSRAGYPLTEVSSAEDAMARAAEHEVLVIDLISKAGGVAEFCRRIRRDRTLGGLPILAIAQADDVEERVALFEAGADEVVARPFDPRELEARMVALELRLAQAGGAVPEPVSHVEPAVDHRLIACFGPKGGTGTTTIAVNVAVALAHHSPGTVAIADLDTQFGQVVTHLGVATKRTIAQLVTDDQALEDPDAMRSYAASVAPGLDVYAAPGSPALAELVTPEAVDLFLRTARESYETVVVDAGSHLDRTTLAIFELADTVIVTVRPELAALTAVSSLVRYLNEIGALRSRTLFVTNHLFGREMVKLRAVEEVLGARVIVEVPHDPFVFLKAVNEGVPVVRSAPKSVAAQRLARLAAMALGESATAERRGADQGRRRLLPGLRLSR